MSSIATTAPLTTEDFMVPANDPGIEIFVRNKRPASMRAFRPERTVLFVHGATYAAHTTFDLPIEGRSWMDHIAARGYDVYLLDLRGYGKSTRPPEMAQSPDANPPIVRTETAGGDIAAAVDFILARRNIPRLVLLGWSWGTFSTPTYTIAHPDKVARLALYAPIWIGQTGRLAHADSGPMPGLPHGDSRTGARTLAQWRARTRKGDAHSARRVRRLGQGHLGNRSGGRATRSAGHPCAQ
jgi:pimeloyl-ACP methyl ester carboxylesterase